MRYEHPIEMRGLAFRYGRKPVLQDVDLHVPIGTTTVLLGGNGEGKSTLLQLCLGALKPRSGVVRVQGLDPIKKRRAVLSDVGYVPDKPDVYAWMTPRHLFDLLEPHYATWDVVLADELCRALDVPMKHAIGSMSKGQGMKTMLVAALASRPRVLLLDEPFGGLDPVVREEVLRLIVSSMGEAQRTVLMTTHDLDVASRIADRIALLSGGRITREGPASDFSASEDAPRPAELKNVLHEEVCS